MWWLTVGCERPDGSTRSHAHTSPDAEATIDRSRSRTGSARAAKLRANISDCASSRVSVRNGGQQVSGSGAVGLRRYVMAAMAE